jgi:hypothetical protein
MSQSLLIRWFGRWIELQHIEPVPRMGYLYFPANNLLLNFNEKKSILQLVGAVYFSFV